MTFDKDAKYWLYEFSASAYRQAEKRQHWQMERIGDVAFSVSDIMAINVGWDNYEIAPPAIQAGVDDTITSFLYRHHREFYMMLSLHELSDEMEETMLNKVSHHIELSSIAKVRKRKRRPYDPIDVAIGGLIR